MAKKQSKLSRLSRLKKEKKQKRAAAGEKKPFFRRLALSRRILFVIVVLLVVALAVFFVLDDKGVLDVGKNAAGSLFSPVQNFFHSISTSVKGFTSNWRSYDALQEEYETLRTEDAQLRMELVSAEEDRLENERLKELLDARDTYDSLDPIYAKVIARDDSVYFVSFSVNRGSNDGVSKDMAVVNGDGLIGHVTEVGLNYAKVVALINSQSSVACLMQRTRDNGVMTGQASIDGGSPECKVRYLPDVNSISPGDVVVTSGTDSLYPKGLKVGQVSAVSLDGGSEGSYAVVTPSVDFSHIEEVFILRTVVETDKDANLPSVEKPEEEYQAAVTPTPNPRVAATPEPKNEDEEIYVRPTSTPEISGGVYSKYKVGNLVEDSWAADT